MPEGASEPVYSSDEQRDHYAAIGKVTGEWAFVEFFLDYHTAQLLGISDKAAVCLQSQVIGPSRKFDAYVAAVRWRGVTKLNKDLDQFGKDIAVLAERRNRVVHDLWMLFPDGPARYELTAKRTIRQKLVPTPTGEVLRLASEITDHRLRLRSLHEQVLVLIAQHKGDVTTGAP